MLSVYVICWIFLQTLSNLFLQANSADPDQTALKEHSDLGPHCLQKWLLKSQADDKADAIIVIGALRVNEYQQHITYNNWEIKEYLIHIPFYLELCGIM